MSSPPRQQREPHSPDFAPVLMVEVEIRAALPEIAAGAAPGGASYRAAQCLVRLHGTPLGFVHADLVEDRVEPEALAELIWRELGDRIRAHLRSDELAVPDSLDPSGLPSPADPPCRGELSRFLERAPFVSVVIPTRNRPESVAATVRGIVATSYPRDRYEVIVVDNGSGDDTPIELADVDPGGAVPTRVVSEPVSGSSNARNRGAREARGEIVVFADDDVDVDRDWLASMVRPFEDPQVAGVGGLTMPNRLETPAQVWFEAFGGFMRGFERRVFDLAEPPADRPLFPFTVGDYGSGQNSACRREAMLGVGGFDPALGPGTLAYDGEDIELMLRMLLAGWRIVYEPAAIVRHEHPPDFEQFRRRVWGYGVGLTACLTKTMVARPGVIPPLLGKLPRGLAYALSPQSEKNTSKPPDFPAGLDRLELRGMAYGPLAYVRSRAHSRREASRNGRPSASEGAPGTLRVLLVTDSFPPLIAGANRSAELLTRHLAERGHSVTVATAWQDGLPAVEDLGRVRVHRIRDLTSRARWISEDPYKHNPPPFPDPEAVAELRRLLREARPDLVHASGGLAHSAAAALRRGEAPLLLTARDYGNFCAVRTFIRRGEAVCEGPGLGRCVDCASWTYGPAKGVVAATSVLGSGRLLRRRVTAVHSVSRYVAEQMDRHLRVPGAISEVIPNFYEDPPDDQPPDEAVLARLPDEPFILYVGAFRQIKGITELLAAHGRLEDAPPLVLIGTRAPDTPASFPPAGVTVIEDVPHPTVMAIWERALFGVLPTKAPETLGNVVLEAMHRGKAMISTRPGGPEDLIVDGETGLLVPGGDIEALAKAMETLVEQPQLRERLERAALERAGLFTPRVVMPQIERLYRRTIESFGGHRS